VSRQSTGLSKAEKRGTNSQLADEQLLFNRRQVADLLGCGVSYIQALEKSGRLQGLRLSRSPTAMVFFRRADLLKLIEEAANAR
jgi:hypothetical protein